MRTGHCSALARRAALLLAPGLLLGLAGCDEPPSDRDRTVVAFVGSDPVYLQDLEEYLRMNLVEMEEDEVAAGDDAVKSRLFDTLIEERLWIAEAERRGVEVSDLELEAYMDFGAAESVDLDEREESEREREARRRLMIQKLQQELLRERPPVTDEEVAVFAERNGDRLIPEQPVELRALQLRSLRQAQRIYDEIRRKRMTFREAVIAHEPSPGQARPRRVSWSGLSERVREALKDLKPGQVSKPVELHGGIYLFQVASWLRDPEDLEAEVRRRARDELEARRRQETLGEALEELRARSRVRIKTENLPFRYVPG